MVKNPPAVQEMQVESLGREDPLEKEMATHSSILGWEIPRTEESGGLQCMGSQKSWMQLSNKTTMIYSAFLFFSIVAYYKILNIVHCESESEVAQSCPTLCDPMDCSPPGFSVHGILQPRILEWVAMLSSRGSFQPRGRTPISCVSGIAGGFFSVEPLAKHLVCNKCSVNICRMN